MQYYRDADLFKSKEDFIRVIDSFSKMLNHLQEQANIGLKFMPAGADVSRKAPFKFYINEVILGNNTIVCELDDLHLSIITYNALNYLITKDVRFGKKLLHGFNTLVSRATLISGIGERERNKFFKLQREKILQLKK